MIERKSGRIVNIGSTAGITGDSWLSVYSATKGAVHAFTRVLAKEVGAHGITVNAVCPRGTAPRNPDEDTSAGSRFNPDAGLLVSPEFRNRMRSYEESVGRDPRRDKTVLGKGLGRQYLHPEEVGAAAVYLASDAGAFLTGHLLVVDGGLTLAA
jgi:2-hydroxycyclohexanecarboxyl-CoA dehydrogenase